MNNTWPQSGEPRTFTTDLTLPLPDAWAISPSDAAAETSCRLATGCAAHARHALNVGHGCRLLSEACDQTLGTLAMALEMRDRETGGHSRRVVSYALTLARYLNLPPEDIATLERGALMHDIGKIGVPDAILWKQGPLTAGEWNIMRNHPDWGGRILSGMPYLDGAARIVSAHQERWDGAGYPDGLSGEAIPLGARIVAVADAFDTITSNRPYRAAQPFSIARVEIARCAGTQFDPRVAAAFQQIPEAVWASA